MLKITPIWPYRLAKLTHHDFEHIAQCAEHIWRYEASHPISPSPRETVALAPGSVGTTRFHSCDG
jgi:hypothetical protein